MSGAAAGGLPANRLRNLRRRVERARQFPVNTCPASRCVHLIAEDLLRGGSPRLQEDPEDCAAAMLSVLESLWKARAELARLDGRVDKRGRLTIAPVPKLVGRFGWLP